MPHVLHSLLKQKKTLSPLHDPLTDVISFVYSIPAIFRYCNIFIYWLIDVSAVMSI